MPEQSHPPYGVNQPRTLNRWLDVNAQNGPLKRARYFIRIPAFTITDFEGSFTYLGTRKFTLTDFSATLNAPYIAYYIVWQDSNGNVFRYRLSNNKGQQMPSGIPLYSNQVILPNFRIEMHDPDKLPRPGDSNVQPNDLILYTSVLAKQDYRYSDDIELVASGAYFQNYSSTNGLFLPLLFDPNSALPTNS